MKHEARIALITVTSCLLLLASCFVRANAHKPSDSYLTLKKHETKKSVIDARWDIALRDLDFAIGLDENNDGAITWGELKAKHKSISDYTLSKFGMKVEGKSCKNKIVNHLVDNHSDGSYAVLKFLISCPGKVDRPKEFDLNYRLFFDIDPQHRGLLNLIHKNKSQSVIFSPEKSTQHFKLENLSSKTQLIQYIKEGIWHIWIGFDHILFLLALLLPSVFVREEGKWKSTASFGKAFWNVFKIVTAFTIAHSITLSLAALDIVHLPSKPVESAIAASVIVAALNNIFPIFSEGRWFIAFLFGLVHGFGFASVLADLGLQKESLIVSLVGFNVGVEAGQLAIVGAFLPIAYFLRTTILYKLLFVFGSFAIIIIASDWFSERMFNFSFLPFL